MRLWRLVTGLACFWLIGTVTGLAHSGGQGEPALELDGISIYASVIGGDGDPVRGLPANAFQVLENGIPQEIEIMEELSPERLSVRLPQEQRWIVFFFSRELDLRELFRAKRAAAWLSEELGSRRDSIAILRDSRLSPFKDDPFSRRFLLRYFGAEDGLRDIVVSRLASWFGSALRSPGSDAAARIGRLIDLGAEGRPSDLLSSLKYLAGRKQVVFFGTRVPVRNWDDPSRDEYLDPLVLADAGFELYAVDVEEHHRRHGDLTLTGMSEWASRAAGAAFRLSSRPSQDLAALSRQMDSSYWLRYKPGPKANCRYRAIEVHVDLDQPVKIRHRPGYFATNPAALPLAERTLATVLEKPESFRDFPLSLAGFPEGGAGGAAGSDTSKLQVILSFPLAAVRLEQDDRKRWQQEVSLFVGVFDQSRERIGGIYRTLAVRAQQEDLDSLMQQTATLNEVIDLPADRNPNYLQAVVVVGHNRQIAAQRYSLNPEE